MQIQTKVASDMNRYLGEPLDYRNGERRFYKRQSARAERRAARLDVRRMVNDSDE